MKVDVLLGLQWGDEGKGKVVDVLTPRYDIVARFQGGPNAGHTLEFEGKKYVLRSIPSGVFQSVRANVIGNGVVLDPVLFKQAKVSYLQKLGPIAIHAVAVVPHPRQTQLLQASESIPRMEASSWKDPISMGWKPISINR